MRIAITCLWIALSCCSIAQGQEHEISGVQVVAPSFDTSALRAYAEDPDYQYTQHAPETSWLQSLWERLLSFLERATSGPDNLWRRVLYYGVAIAGVLLLIYFLARARYNSLLARRDRALNDIRILDTDVAGDRIPGLIDSALVEGNYRLAYRWMYIGLLKSLGEEGLLQLHRNKTNRDYIAELRESRMKNAVVELARVFDYTWYGEYPMTPEQFQYYRSQIGQILAQTRNA